MVFSEITRFQGLLVLRSGRNFYSLIKFRWGVYTEEMKDRTGFSWSQIEQRKKEYLEPFYPTISLFEKEKSSIPEFHNVSFEAFVDYVSTFDEDESYFDWHWRSYTYFCSPCQFQYKYLLHLENLDAESQELFDLWKLPLGFHLPT